MTNREKYEAHIESCDGCDLSMVELLSTPTDDRILESGYRFVRFDRECFAQFPKEFRSETIPDEYIFAADWNRERVNDWWKRLDTREYWLSRSEHVEE